VKFERTGRFKRDYKDLPDHHRDKVRAAARDFHEGAVRAAAGEAHPWPNSLRVKPVEGAQGVWEMTWSWTDPDGRATWEWIEIDGERAVLWRRIGTHVVLKSP